MTLDQAINKAREESKNGYVQHVNVYWSVTFNKSGLCYVVSDWCDSSTMYSFENGRQL